MKIVLLEFMDEAKFFIEKGTFKQEDIKVICLHPKTLHFLKSQGVEAENSIAYFNNDAQHRCIEHCDKLTAEILKRISLRDEFNIERGYKETLKHHLRLYINHFLWILEILDDIRKKFNVDEIVCPTVARQSMYSSIAYIQDHERFLGLLAEDFCKVHDIKFSSVRVSVATDNIFKMLASRIVRLIGNLLGTINFKLASGNIKDNDQVVIVPALSYRMDLLIKELKNRHEHLKCFMVWEGGSSLRQETFKIYLLMKNFFLKLKGKNLIETVINVEHLGSLRRRNRVQQDTFSQALDSLVSLIESELDAKCTYADVSFASFLTEKIDRSLRWEILELRHLTAVLNDIFIKLNPKLVMSMYSVGITYMMGELSEIRKVNSLNITHGTHVPPNNDYEEIENYELSTSVISNTYKYVAVQTPWAHKFLDYYNDQRPRLETGPLLFSVTDDQDRQSIRREILGDNQNAKIVVHATTQKGRHGFRFHITESLDEYLATISDLVNAVNQLDDVYLLVRPHPICNLTNGEIRSLVPDCKRLVIKSTGTFAPILSAADLLVSYSSTCIEEALQNNIPVLLYDQWRRYNHFGVLEATNKDDFDRKSVHYLTDSHFLKDGMRIILDLTATKPLEDSDLKEYKLPRESKEKFFQFVDQALKETMNREYSLNTR